MKHIKTLLLALTLLSVTTSVAQEEKSNTVKLEVSRTDKGFDIKALTPNNVYVRKPGNGDKAYYIFVSQKYVEFVCNCNDSIELAKVHQPGKVTCYSQAPDADQPKQDKRPPHVLVPNPTHRRNWIELTELNANTGVDISIQGNNAEQKIHFCFTGARGEISEILSRIESPKFHLNEDSTYVSDTLTLKRNDKYCIPEFTRTDSQKYNLVLNRLLLDGKEQPFEAYRDTLKLDSSDDIMFGTTIKPQTDSLQLEEGDHTIVYECIVLTSQGPKTVELKSIVEVEGDPTTTGGSGPSPMKWYWYVVIACIIIAAILYVFRKKIFFILRKRKKSEKDEDEQEEDDGTPIRGNDIHKECEELLPGADRPEQPTTTAPVDKAVHPVPSDEPASFVPSDDTLPAEEVAKEVWKLVDKKKVKSVEELSKQLKKIGMEDVISRWNKEHPNHAVSDDNYHSDGLMSVINGGYVGDEVKSLMSNLFDMYGLPKDINKTSFDNLIVFIKQKGKKEGRYEESQSQASKAAEWKQNQDGLEKEIKGQKIENKALQGENDKLKRELDQKTSEKETLSKRVKELEDNPIRIDPNPDLQKEVERNKEELDQKQRTIDDKERELKEADVLLSANKEEIEKLNASIKNLTKGKEKWEDEYRKTSDALQVANGMLQTIEEKHKNEVDKLKSDHQEAQRILKDDCKNRIQAKDKQLQDQETEYQQKLEAQAHDLNNQHEEEIKKLKSDREQAEAKLLKTHEEEVVKLRKTHDEEVVKLNGTISMMRDEAFAGRDQLIEQANNYLEAIATDMARMEQSVNGISGQQKIFISNIEQIVKDLKEARETFDEMCRDEWKLDTTKQQQVTEDLCKLCVRGLRKAGWINNMTLLMSYSRIPTLPDELNLNEELEAHGISIALVERICANIEALLGKVGIGLVVPAVLANNYSLDAYDYENADIWIDKFFTRLNSRSFKGKVFDIVQVGYTINGQLEKKPIVQFI